MGNSTDEEEEEENLISFKIKRKSKTTQDDNAGKKLSMRERLELKKQQ